MKQCLATVLALLALGVIQLLASPLAEVNQKANEIPDDKNELEKHFRESYAQRVKSYMNTSVNPCVDFYEYACGNYPNVIADYESEQKRGNLVDIFFTILEQLDDTLTKHRDSEEQYYEELQTAKKYMDSCVNAKLWPLEPSPEFLSVLKEIGGFPAVDPTWRPEKFDWFKMMAHLARYGVEGLVKENIFLKYPFPPYYKLPKFGFNFDVYPENIKTKQSPGYLYNQEAMKKLLTAYGVNETKANQVVDEIVDFWRSMLEYEKSLSDMGQCESQVLLIDFPTDDIQFNRWPELFDIAWNNSENIEFTYTDISECPCIPYYHKLDLLFKKSPQVAANYMSLKFLHTMHANLKSDKFQRTFCLKLIKRSMPLLMSHFYLREHYLVENEQDIFTIIFELKDSLQKLMETSDWLDGPTKIEALKKVKTLQARVGKIEDPIGDTLIKQIRKLQPSDNHATNVLELAKFSVDRSHYLYLHPEIAQNTTPPEIIDAAQVNAFHYVLDNSINVMAGVLNPPAYHPHMPQSAKYGALGYILGHELTHGFDSSGSHFNAELEFSSWWSDNSATAFFERSNCFAEHYSKYRVPELNRNVNGTISLDENIADSGGLREAFAAYRKIYKAAAKASKTDFERRETLPGLNLNPEQTFFLSFAQLYCAKYSPKDFWMELTDDHPLDKYRVLGSLQNFEEFALVYDCPLGSPMNPNEKCRLW